MKSGTPDKPTRLLGRNWQNCAADSQKTSMFLLFFLWLSCPPFLVLCINVLCRGVWEIPCEFCFQPGRH